MLFYFERYGYKRLLSTFYSVKIHVSSYSLFELKLDLCLGNKKMGAFGKVPELN